MFCFNIYFVINIELYFYTKGEYSGIFYFIHILFGEGVILWFWHWILMYSENYLLCIYLAYVLVQGMKWLVQTFCDDLHDGFLS